MTKRTLFLSSKAARQRAHVLIDSAPEGWVVKIAEPTRSDEQNRKLWPTIQEIQRQVPEMAPYSAEDIKLRFLNALGTEMRFLPVLEGQGSFPVGYRSSTLTVEQFSLLIELLHKYGAEHGVTFKEAA
jgi:hypothetical protein